MELNLHPKDTRTEIMKLRSSTYQEVFFSWKREILSVKYSTTFVPLWHKDILVLSKCAEELHICTLETKKGFGEVKLYSVTRINIHPELQTIEKRISKVLNLKYYYNLQLVQHSQVTTPREIPMQSIFKTSNGHSTIQKNVRSPVSFGLPFKYTRASQGGGGSEQKLMWIIYS